MRIEPLKADFVDCPTEGDDLDRRTLLQQAVATLALTLTGCSGDSGAATDTVAAASTPTAAVLTTAVPTCVPPGSSATLAADARTGFVHPGLLNTAESLERMYNRVRAAEQPWQSGWAMLQADPYSSLTANPRPLEEVTRPGNSDQMVVDMQRTYLLAVAWKVSGDTRYADRAVVFLDAWSSVMKRLSGNTDHILAAGLYGFQWACAAEIMRTYPGWPAVRVADFQRLLRTVFYPYSSKFLVDHNGADITNFWGSWDLLSIAGIIAIGVFCDDIPLYEEAKAYFLNGRGNGASSHMVYRIHSGLLGQYHESGRDQGHVTLGIACLSAICEIAWSQGDDLYGHWNNRLLSAAEYVAASNVPDAAGAYVELPFSRFVNRQGTFTAVSTAGRPHLRPCWEAIYHHYVNRRGLSAPYVTRMVATVRPERRDRSGDAPGLGTLLYSLPPIAQPAAPSGVVARVAGNVVVVDWWGTADATGYSVERSSSACGPFTTVANVDERRTYSDTPPAGVWYYRVTAMSRGSTLSSIPVRVAFTGELWFHLPLIEGSGTAANDATGRFGVSTLTGGVGWGTGRTGGSAPVLDGRSGHIAMPPGVMEALADCTVSLWVYADAPAARRTWLFSIGGSDITYFSLMANDVAGRPRTVVTRTTGFGEQGAPGVAALPTGRWAHVALTLIGRAMTLYVDGAVAGSNGEVDLAPYQMGKAVQNWIGRSPYAADPYFSGRVQDVRVHSRGLSATEVAALTTG